MVPNSRKNIADRTNSAELPLSAVQSLFNRIADSPVPHEAGPSSQVTSWRQLRDWLSDPQVPIAELDGVWGCLVRRARCGGDREKLTCAAMAWPMLVGLADRHMALSGAARSRQDIESDILSGFVTALPFIDLDRPFVCFRLRWSAHRGGYASVQPRSGEVAASNELLVRAPVVDRPGHPDLVLAEAVAEGIVTARIASLIVLTRLEGRSVRSVAEEWCESYEALAKSRCRAERKLGVWLRERAAILDPMRTSVVEAEALQSVALSEAAESRLSKNGTSGRSTKCGQKSAFPAQPTSVEVKRPCA